MEDLDTNEDLTADDEGLQGEVQRHASTSTAIHADSAPEQDQQRAKKRKRRQAPPTPTDALEIYARRLDTHAQDLYSHLHGADRRWLRGAQGERIASDQWSDEDLALFFTSLARRSRLRPDLIADDLGGRKTTFQVSAYLSQLSAATLDATPTRPFAICPAAREVSDKWLKQEERLAGRLQGQLNDKTTYDQKVCNATWFLHSRLDFVRTCDPIAIETSTVPAYALADLAAEMQIRRAGRGLKRGMPRQRYRVFGELHPLPTLTGGDEFKRGRPRKVKRRRRDDGVEELHHEDGPDKTSAYRVLIRAIELGLLLVVQDEGQRHTLPGLTRHTEVVKYKGQPIGSKQKAPLPKDHLDSLRVVFVTAIPEGVDSSKLSLHRSGLARMQEASVDGLSRILASVTHEEMRWLEARDVATPSQQHASNTSQPQSSTAITRGRGHTRDEYRGYSLAGMSADERERFKARIRAREAKYGAELTRQSPPTTPIQPREKWQGIHGNRQEELTRAKYAVLAAFEDELKAMSPKERKKTESKLRARVRSWGPQKTLLVGLQSAREARSVTADTDRQSVSGQSRELDCTVDTLDGAATDEVAEDELISNDTAPDSDKSRRGARFLAIGWTRARVREHLNQQSGRMFNLNALGVFLSASVMTSCTRPDEFDSLVDQEIPLRFNLCDTLPRLEGELRSFVASVIRNVVVELDLESGSSRALDGSHIRRVLSARDTSTPDNRDQSHCQIDSQQCPPDSWIDSDSEDDIDTDFAVHNHHLLHSLFLSGSLRSQPTSDAEFTPDDWDTDDEVFESHHEAAQVESVRRLWGRGARNKGTDTSITGGFFWPEPNRAPAKVDLADEVESSEDEREVDDTLDVEQYDDDDEDDDDNESAVAWENAERKDQKQDAWYEKRAWLRWFGSADASDEEAELSQRDQDVGDDEVSDDVVCENGPFV